MTAYHTLSDPELAALLSTDGEVVFGIIYQRYWTKLYTIATKRLRDETEAEEVIQDIFCNLWRKRDRLVLTRGFDNYFAVAVKFEVINRLAKKAKATTYQRELARNLSEIDESTVHQLDYLELQQKFDIAVLSLPEKCRIVFKLQHEKGHTHQQIADELGISTKTVEAHLSKARKALRATFGNFLGFML